jgi:phosphohistidine swiveling domain-containing protein
VAGCSLRADRKCDLSATPEAVPSPGSAEKGGDLPAWSYWLTTWPTRSVLLSRGNTADGYPRALTPLSQDLILEFEDRGIHSFLEETLKAQSRGQARMPYFVALWGHVYVNADQHAALGEALPGNSARATYRRYLGLEPDPEAEGPPPSLTHRLRVLPRRAAVLVRMARQGLGIRRRINRQTAVIRGLRRDDGTLGLVEAGEWVQDLEAITAPAWETLMLGAGIAGTVFGATVRLVGRVTGGPADDLVNRLHTGIGGNETAEVASAIRLLATTARQEPTLREALGAETPMEDLRDLSPEFVALVDVTLDRFGFHTAPELELEQPSWRQDPQQLLTVVIRELTADRAVPAGLPVKVEAEAEIRRHVPLRWRPVVSAALFASRWLMPSRENSKIPAVMIFDELRRVLEVVSPELVVRGVLRSPEDAVLLQYRELKGILNGGQGPGTDEIARRRRELERCRQLRLPELLEAGPSGAQTVSEGAIRSRGLRPSVRASERDDVLHGVGAGSGSYRGTVRLLDDPLADFEPGDILVAQTVDPGWSAALSCAGAVVLDIGGVMSHGAMVARELGIPCVVGVRSATRRLTTGTTVTVDGSAGSITIHDQPAVVAAEH